MYILDPCPFVLDFPWFHFLFHQIKDTFTFCPKSLPLQFHDNLRQSQTHPSSHEKPIRKPNSDFLIQIFKWKMIAEVDPPPVNKVLFSLHTIYHLCHQKGTRTFLVVIIITSTRTNVQYFYRPPHHGLAHIPDHHHTSGSPMHFVP